MAGPGAFPLRTALAELDLRQAGSLRQALELMREPGLTPLAGATDLYVELNFGTLKPRRFLDLWALDELRDISLSGDTLVIGALATFTALIRSPLVQTRLPMLVEAARLVGGVQIQNRGTLGGNIANASPAGDTLPVLLATDAEIVVGGARGERSIPVTEFWVAYRKTALAPDELVLRVRIPLPAGREVRFRKIGTRRAQAISKVVMALAWRDGGRGWSDVRLGLGSVADRPIRARKTESALEGRKPTVETADKAAATLAAEIAPIDDVRSTADYRKVVAARVLHRLVRDAGGW